MEHLKSHSISRSGDLVEISISPPDHMQFHGHPTTSRLMLFKTYWRDRINAFICGTSDHTVFIEISSAGRLHLHGICQIDEPVTFHSTFHTLVNGKPSKGCKFIDRCENAIYKITSQKHFEERSAYVSKDYPVVSKLINPIFSSAGSKLKKAIMKYLPKIEATKFVDLN